MKQDNTFMVALGFIGLVFIAILLTNFTTLTSGTKFEENARNHVYNMFPDATEVRATCTNMDTDQNGYVSCSVTFQEPGADTKTFLPLECSTLIYVSDACRIAPMSHPHLNR